MLKVLKRIPGFAPGILFFALAAGAPAQIDLATGLFEDGDWTACRRECRRTLDRQPSDDEALLLEAVCRLRLRTDVAGAQKILDGLVASSSNVPVRTMAAYELGRQRWRDGDPEQAFRLLSAAFAESPSRDLYLHAGCSLRLLIDQYPSLGTRHPAVVMQLDSSCLFWSRQIWNESALEKTKSGGLLARPEQWIVSFYRTQIRPAIGSRCSLNPGCSEYFRLAGVQHGLLAFPMIGDRLVREPSVVQEAKKPVDVGGQMRIADPISDHDFWMNP